MRASLTRCLAPWILVAQLSPNMGAVPAITPAPPSTESVARIRDRGGLFSRGAERGARRELGRSGVPVLIETVDTLGGESIAEAARRRFRRAGARGLYVLVADRERDVAVAAAGDRPPAAGRSAIREAFLGPLRAGDADAGLERGARAIGEVLADPAGDATPRRPRDATAPLAITLALLGLLLAIRLRAGRHDAGRVRRDRNGRAAPVLATGRLRIEGGGFGELGGGVPPPGDPLRAPAARGPRRAVAARGGIP